jgi:hypothetical protein
MVVLATTFVSVDVDYDNGIALHGSARWARCDADTAYGIGVARASESALASRGNVTPGVSGGSRAD